MPMIGSQRHKAAPGEAGILNFFLGAVEDWQVGGRYEEEREGKKRRKRRRAKESMREREKGKRACVCVCERERKRKSVCV